MAPDAENDPRPRVQTCVMCGKPAVVYSSLCSRECLAAAERELDENQLVLQLGPRTPPAVRTKLAARNGQLTSAISRSG